jgi:hypothetical protein
MRDHRVWITNRLSRVRSNRRLRRLAYRAIGGTPEANARPRDMGQSVAPGLISTRARDRHCEQSLQRKVRLSACLAVTLPTDISCPGCRSGFREVRSDGRM